MYKFFWGANFEAFCLCGQLAKPSKQRLFIPENSGSLLKILKSHCYYLSDIAIFFDFFQKSDFGPCICDRFLLSLYPRLMTSVSSYNFGKCKTVHTSLKNANFPKIIALTCWKLQIFCPKVKVNLPKLWAKLCLISGINPPPPKKKCFCFEKVEKSCLPLCSFRISGVLPKIGCSLSESQNVGKICPYKITTNFPK